MTKKAESQAPLPEPESYGAALEELEALVADMESGQLPLESLLGHYQRGNALLRYCRQKLQVVQDQVKLLDEDGSAEPWEGGSD